MWSELTSAAAAPGGQFTIPPGVYDFGTNRLILAGVQNFKITAIGVEFMFDKGVRFNSGGVLFQNCRNVEIDGLSIDFKATTAQGVLAYWIDRQNFVATLDIGNFRDPTSDAWFTEESPTTKVMFVTEASLTHNMLRHPTKIQAVNVFAKEYQVFERFNDTHMNVKITTNTPVDGPLGRTAPPDFPTSYGDMPRQGTPLAIIPRGGQHAFVLAGSEGIIVNRLSIFASPNFGVNEKFGDGSANIFTNLFIGPRNLPGTNIPRYIATNADGFHSNGNALGPTIVESEISYTGDDHVNIYCFQYIVISADPAAGVITLLDHGDALFDRLESLLGTGVSQTLSFYALQDDLHAMQGQGVRVTGATRATEGSPDERAQQARGLLLEMGESFQDAAFKKPTAIECQVDLPQNDPLWGALGEGLKTLVVHDQAKNKDALAKDNKFHESYARSSMIKSSGARFTGNSYSAGGGVFIQSAKKWLEGDPGLGNIAFKDNCVQGVGVIQGPEAKNIDVANNGLC